MDIGAAKVSAADRARVPHHGLDLVDPDELFTAADFQRHAYDVLPGIAARGRIAIMAAGTGLYLRSVGGGGPLGEGAGALRGRFGVHPRAFSAFGYFEALAVADGEIEAATAIERDAGRTR